MQGKRRKAKERRRSISYSLSECVINKIDEVPCDSPRSVVVEQLLIEALRLRKRQDVGWIYSLTYYQLSWIAKLCSPGQTPEEYLTYYVDHLVEKAQRIAKLNEEESET